MTVAQLIEKLKAMPQDAEVITEGCDCLGEVSDVSLYRYRTEGEPKSVLIERSAD